MPSVAASLVWSSDDGSSMASFTGQRAIVCTSAGQWREVCLTRQDASCVLVGKGEFDPLKSPIASPTRSKQGIYLLIAHTLSTGS